MNRAMRQLGHRGRKVLLVIVAATLASAGLAAVEAGRGDMASLRAEFPRTVGLYEGAEVKVLGVPVGTVDRLDVAGTKVVATISYAADVRLPADVRAVIVPPSIVGDRFVELTPAWTEGPTLQDGATLGTEATGVPIELDETFSALDDLAVALGPRGADSEGALGGLVDAAADLLTGNGSRTRRALEEFGAALSTVRGASGDTAGTVRNLDRITSALAGSDDEVRRLVSGLTRVGEAVAGQRRTIVRAVRGLRLSLGEVRSFVAANARVIGSSTRRLTKITRLLSTKSSELSDLLDYAPLGLTSVHNLYVPKNWDPTRPFATPIEGRTGSAALRYAFLDTLPAQLGHTILSLCDQLPADLAAEVDALCGALSATGGDLGAILSDLAKEGPVILDPATSGAER